MSYYYWSFLAPALSIAVILLTSAWKRLYLFDCGLVVQLQQAVRQIIQIKAMELAHYSVLVERFLILIHHSSRPLRSSHLIRYIVTTLTVLCSSNPIPKPSYFSNPTFHRHLAPTRLTLRISGLFTDFLCLVFFRLILSRFSSRYFLPFLVFFENLYSPQMVELRNNK